MLYLLTNRQIVKEPTARSPGRIRADGEEAALPTFRIARVPDKPNEDAPYELYRDGRFVDYQDLEAGTAADALTGSQRMFRELYDAMLAAQNQNKGDVLVFVHGFQFTLKDSLENLYQIKHAYLDPPDSRIGHIVYVSWPSVGRFLSLPRPGAATAYHDDQRDARDTGRCLARAFERLSLFMEQFFVTWTAQGKEKQKNPLCGHKVHLAAHSMGNQVVERFMEALPASHHRPLFSEVLLLHADCANDVLEPGKPLHALPLIGERVHVYNHYGDAALTISRFTKNFDKRLGKYGPRRMDALPERTLVVDTTHAPAGDETGFKERVGDHWGYLHRPTVVGDIRAVLDGQSASAIVGRGKTDTPRLYRVQKPA